jgi:hypothetical protein
MDNWLEGFGPLINHALQEIPVEMKNLSIAKMVNINEQWRWEAFAHLLPMQVTVAMASDLPPTSVMNDDKVF